MATQPQTLTPEQGQALRAFAGKHGRAWRQALRDAWMRRSDSREMRRIRNTFGPVWNVMSLRNLLDLSAGL